MKDTIEMAREAGFSFGMTEPVVMVRYIPQDGLERFAELVRADEREAVEELLKEYDMVNSTFAKDFRARSNT